MQPKLHFISGLPRSGSTLLSALLRQNPQFHASMTSPIGSLFVSNLQLMSAGSEIALLTDDNQRKAILKGIFSSYYEEMGDKSVIFDTNRIWCSKLPALLNLYPEAKIICCVRNVAWIMDSIERLLRQNPFENTRLFGNDVERNTVYSRVETLAQPDRLVGLAWCAFKEAFYSEYAPSLLVLDYELFTRSPEEVMPLIYQFIGEPTFEHDYDQVEFDAPEFDQALGVSGLHRVHQKVEFKQRDTILPPDLFEQYSTLAFWSDHTGSTANIIAPRRAAQEPPATS